MKSLKTMLALLCALSSPYQLSAEVAQAQTIASQTRGYTLVKDQTSLQVLSPALQNRKIGKIILDNGLQAYLVSDPGVEQSAAGLAVEAGSWQDPKAYPGLAHFLEHMLFMGTKAYPDEGEYMQFIADHGGTVNAYTASDRTVYMLSVNNDSFKAAVDRFSHFFIDPLFSPNSISRELHAVDQEHAKNIEHDGWRQYMIFKETANPNHPHCSFSTGNAKTLSGIPQESLKKWYQEHYSAGAMHLVLVSPLPLNELISLTVEKFSKVPSFKQQKQAIDSPILSSAQKGHMIFIKPVKEMKQLSFAWEVPAPFASDMERRAPELVAYALSQEDSNSLISLLKKENLAEGIHAACDRYDKTSLIFEIDIALTDQGVHELDRVISATYAMLSLLETQGFPKSVYDELKTLSELSYQYQARKDPFASVTSLTEDLVYENLATYPQKTLVPSTYDPEFIGQFLHILTPENCVYFVQAAPEKTGILPDTKEKWMNAEYAIKEISPDRMLAWGHPTPIEGLKLPSQNPYLPQNLHLVSVPQGAPSQENPILLSQDEGSKIYFAYDTHYLLPELGTYFSIKTPLLDTTAEASVLSDLYLKALGEDLSEILHHAGTAGIRTSLSSGPFGIQVITQGFSDPVPILLTEIFAKLKTVHPTSSQFELYKTSLKLDYANSSKELPVKQAMETLNHVLAKTPTDQEKIKSLQGISYEEFLEFSKNLFKTAYVEGFLYGNIEKTDASVLWLALKTTLDASPYPTDSHKHPQILVLDEKYGPYMLKETSDRQGNGVVLLLEEGSFSFDKRAAQQILGCALKEGFFNALRTKQQTAYIAKAWNTEEERQLLQYFAVQSNTHYPSELLPRFELFIEDFHKNLSEIIPHQRFENIQNNLVTIMEKQPENMGGMLRELADLAFEYEDFSWYKKRIDSLKNLSYKDFCKIASEFLSRDNPRRLAVLVEGVLPKEHDFRYEQVSREDIHQLGSFVSVK